MFYRRLNFDENRLVLEEVYGGIYGKNMYFVPVFPLKLETQAIWDGEVCEKKETLEGILFLEDRKHRVRRIPLEIQCSYVPNLTISFNYRIAILKREIKNPLYINEEIMEREIGDVNPREGVLKL